MNTGRSTIIEYDNTTGFIPYPFWIIPDRSGPFRTIPDPSGPVRNRKIFGPRYINFGISDFRPETLFLTYKWIRLNRDTIVKQSINQHLISY